MSEQPRARPAALDRHRGHRRLRHRLAGAAGERGPDVAHHLEPAGAVFQDFGHVLAHLAQRAAAGAAGAALGGQVLDISPGQGLGHAADRDDLLVGPDCLLPALGHAPSPLEQQAGRDAVQPRDGGDRHAGLHGLLDQPDLFLGSVAPPAVDAGDDLNALDGLRHRRALRRELRPSGLCHLSGRIGGRSTGQHPRPQVTKQQTVSANPHNRTARLGTRTPTWTRTAVATAGPWHAGRGLEQRDASEAPVLPLPSP